MLAWVGFYWGTWLRWTPEYGTLFTAAVTMPQILGAVMLFMLLVGLAYWGMLRTTANFAPQDLQLPLVPALVVVLMLLLVFLAQAGQGNYPGTPLLVCLILWIVCIAIVWFRRPERAVMLLSAHFPPTPISWRVVVVGVIGFGITLSMGYTLPLIGNAAYNQLWLMEIGYGVVGFFWLPLLASVIAVRGIDRQMRARQIDPF
jgi:hypothetical protein